MTHSNSSAAKAEVVFLADTDVAARYSVSRNTIWRWRRTDQTFPAPVSLGAGTSRWRLADLELWEAAKAGAAA